MTGSMLATLKHVTLKKALHRLFPRIATGVVLATLSTVACHSEDEGPCFPEVAVGVTLEATLIEEWNEQSQFEVVGTNQTPTPLGCSHGDLSPGDVVQFTLVKNYERDKGRCDLRLASVTVPGVTLSNPIEYATAFGPAAVAQAWYGRATLPNGCEGSLAIAVVQPFGSKGIFEPAVPGEVPPVVIIRDFLPDASKPCPTAMERHSLCRFAATLQRL